jgi:hypothetical protein
MESKGGGGGDSNHGPSIYYYVCDVTHYFLGAINRERHGQKGMKKYDKDLRNLWSKCEVHNL